MSCYRDVSDKLIEDMDRRFPEALHHSKWKTYLWVLVSATIFTTYLYLQLFEFLVRFNEVWGTKSLQILLAPSMFLMVAWSLWIVIFGSRLFQQSNSKYYDEEDFEYVNRKFSKYYRLFDITIALYFLMLLMSVFYLFLRILSF